MSAAFSASKFKDDTSSDSAEVETKMERDIGRGSGTVSLRPTVLRGRNEARAELRATRIPHYSIGGGPFSFEQGRGLTVSCLHNFTTRSSSAVPIPSLLAISALLFTSQAPESASDAIKPGVSLEFSWSVAFISPSTMLIRLVTLIASVVFTVETPVFCFCYCAGLSDLRL
ncbi:hypothetical protein Moror_4691 [Moniliophthora roreri MCA 2997]|uniref:Uncharacterized protein n=1 Tax=Moniliophthora roreri (strain MCA 2997) TaxID=1381753 RepID=V2WZL2_MONRO|nr:hypothetical protein Moror_4691 [Moniliophthora roreri MCA 2997]